MDEVCRSEVLRSTSSRRLIATPLDQPPVHYLSKALMGSDDLGRDVQQLQPLIRLDVEQRDDEGGRGFLPPIVRVVSH